MHFLMATSMPLGELEYIRIWHDNSGAGNFASWYLNKIEIFDIQTNQSWVPFERLISWINTWLGTVFLVILIGMIWSPLNHTWYWITTDHRNLRSAYCSHTSRLMHMVETIFFQLSLSAAATAWFAYTEGILPPPPPRSLSQVFCVGIPCGLPLLCFQ